MKMPAYLLSTLLIIAYPPVFSLNALPVAAIRTVCTSPIIPQTAKRLRFGLKNYMLPTKSQLGGKNLLHSYAQAGQVALIQEYIVFFYTTGADIKSILNETCGQGKTPLHYACQAGMTEAVRYLLSQGVSTSVVDHEGQTARERAQEFAHHETRAALIALLASYEN